MRALSLLLILFFTAAAHAEKRTVFVQLFEWPWKDIARECETYLGPAGFSAVQVSPPQEHLSTSANTWWERYQVVSYQLTSRGGDENAFADMVHRCQKAGVDIYVDAVMNHMAGVESGIGSAGTAFQHYEYPGLFSRQDFHHCGRNGNDHIVNFLDLFELQNCELVNLADLATESPSVQAKQVQYLNHLLDLGVKGFRFDAAKHMPARDIGALVRGLKTVPHFLYQEIIYDPAGPVRYDDYTPNGSVTAYAYSFSVADALKNARTDLLYHIPRDLPDSTRAVVSLTNHDLERNADRTHLLSYLTDSALYRLGQIFMLAWPYGYPQVYSGYQFTNYDQGPPVDERRRTRSVLDDQNHCASPWTCEHRLPEVAAMVFFRNQTDANFTVTHWWTNGRDQLAFGRGSLGFVAINYSQQVLTRDFSTSLAPGFYCNILAPDFQNKKCPAGGVQVKADGTFRVRMAPLSALALLAAAPATKAKK